MFSAILHTIHAHARAYYKHMTAYNEWMDHACTTSRTPHNWLDYLASLGGPNFTDTLLDHWLACYVYSNSYVRLCGHCFFSIALPTFTTALIPYLYEHESRLERFPGRIGHGLAP